MMGYAGVQWRWQENFHLAGCEPPHSL